jgi:acetylornithine deacetylase/succinyl-diaminopimelate desuccinylase-like protein
MLDGEAIVEAQFVTDGELPPELPIPLAWAHAGFVPDVRKVRDLHQRATVQPHGPGVVARLPGQSGGRMLMFNGHIDVVPPGDLAAWTGGDPFSGSLADCRLFGRGACDMKGGRSDLVDRVAAAHRLAGGNNEPEVWGAPYGSDLRLLTGIGGISTLHYGPGDAGLAHGPNESVSVNQVEMAARTLAVLALDLCG